MEKADPSEFLKTGGVHLLADLLKNLDSQRPANPTAFLASVIHRNKGGMQLNVDELKEFLKEATQVNSVMLFHTLMRSLPCELPSEEELYSDWHPVLMLAADAVVAAYKTESALPSDAQLIAVHAPLLLHLIFNMARSKFALSGLSKPVNVCLAMELHVSLKDSHTDGDDDLVGGGGNKILNSASSPTLTIPRDDRPLLRPVGENSQRGRHLIVGTAEEIQWLASGTKNNVNWELVFVDTTANNSTNENFETEITTSPAKDSCAAIASMQIAKYMSKSLQSKVRVVSAPTLLQGIFQPSQPANAASKSNANDTKKYDAVVMLQQAKVNQYFLQLGLILRPLLDVGGSAPPVAMLDYSRTAFVDHRIRYTTPVEMRLIDFLLASLLKVDILGPVSHFTIRSNLIGMKGEFARNYALALLKEENSAGKEEENVEGAATDTTATTTTESNNNVIIGGEENNLIKKRGVNIFPSSLLLRGIRYVKRAFAEMSGGSKSVDSADKQTKSAATFVPCIAAIPNLYTLSNEAPCINMEFHEAVKEICKDCQNMEVEEPPQEVTGEGEGEPPQQVSSPPSSLVETSWAEVLATPVLSPSMWKYLCLDYPPVRDMLLYHQQLMEEDEQQGRSDENMEMQDGKKSSSTTIIDKLRQSVKKMSAVSLYQCTLWEQYRGEMLRQEQQLAQQKFVAEQAATGKSSGKGGKK